MEKNPASHQNQVKNNRKRRTSQDTDRYQANDLRRNKEIALRQRADELAALHALSIEIAAATDLSSLLLVIVQRSVGLLKAQGGSLALCDEVKQELHLVAEHYPGVDIPVGLVFQYGEGAVGRVAQSGEPLIIDDYRTWEGRSRQYEESQPYTAVLSVPMIWQGRVIGVLQVLADTAIRQFTQADQELLTLFAVQAAGAIENARLLEAERRWRQETETLSNATSVLTSSLDLSQVLELILNHLEKVVPYHCVSVYLLEGNFLKIVAGRGFADSDRVIGTEYPSDDPTFHNIRDRGHSLILENAPDNHLRSRQDQASEIRSWMGVPLIVRSEVIGFVSLENDLANAYTIESANLAEAFANQAAIAIENARLYSRAAAEQRHISMLYELGRELTASLEPDEILNRAVSLTCQALDGLLGQGFRFHGETNKLILNSIYGRPEGWLDNPKNRIILSLGQGFAGWVGKNKEATYLPNVLEDERWIHIDGVDNEVRSALSAPIITGDRLLGVLSILHVQEGAFSENHQTLLQAICQEVGLALTNAERYQQVQRQLAEITFSQNLSQTFNRRLQLQELLNEVVVQLAAQLNYPLVEIFLIDGEMLNQRAAFGVKPHSDRLHISQGIVGRVARTGQVAVVLDVSQDPDYLPTYPDTVSELVVPICHGSMVVGVINIEIYQPGQLETRDRDLLEMLAGQISIALENAVLYEHLREHAEGLEVLVNERTVEIVELYELSQKIGYTLSDHELLKMLLSHLRNAVRSDIVLGGLLKDGQQVIYVDSARPIDLACMHQLQAYCGDVFPDCELPDKEILSAPIETSPLDASSSSLVPIKNIESLIHQPITIGDEVVGILIAGCERANAFDEAQERILDTFANQATGAIQRLTAMLAAEQKRMEALVEHLPLGVLLLDSEYRLLMANPLGKEILSELRADIQAGQLSQLGPLDIDELVSHQDENIPLEIVLHGPARRVFIAQARAGGEESNLFVITIQDVTQERESQARIQMQERLATVGQLAAGIAHDFNNIMAAILVYTDLLMDDPEIPDESRERLQIIEQQVQRAASLIRQILDFSHRSVMEQSDVDLLPFIKELDKMLRRVLPETIQLELSYTPGTYLVRADPTRIQQAFMNLVLNARDAMPDGGLLRFELNRITIKPEERAPLSEIVPGDWIRISVKDTGVGIQTDQLPHIFEPFYTTKPIGQGTGLGLAQVYGIIKQHKGFIDVKSRVGHGTAFTIYLPISPESKPDEPKSESPVRVDGVGKTVLVVEDDPTTREALQALLEAHRYYVKTAINGVEALQLLELDQKKIDLVVSDIVMPQMGGVALYRAIQDRWPAMKMLLVTGHPLEGDGQAMLEAGRISWLQKPFSAKIFNQAVYTLLVE